MYDYNAAITYIETFHNISCDRFLPQGRYIRDYLDEHPDAEGDPMYQAGKKSYGQSTLDHLIEKVMWDFPNYIRYFK